MPSWIHERVDSIRAKNPGISESTAWGVATQQAHKLGKTPKDYGTAQGRRVAKAKYDQPVSEYKKTASFASFYDEVSEVLKSAMIPTSPTMLGAAKNPAAESLAKAQKVGTPDDPNGPKYKALNQVKPTTSGTQTAVTGSPALKLGSVARDFFAKVAFSASEFSGDTFVFRPQYTSGVRPVGENVEAASVMDPKLSGDAPLQKEKKAFSEAGFGAASSHGAWDGNGGNHASGLHWEDPGPAFVMDPKLSGDAPPNKYTRAVMLKEGTDPGAPRITAPPGPSIAQVSKPKGYGVPLPGALKNRI